MGASLCNLAQCESGMKEAAFRRYDRNPKGLRSFVHGVTGEITVDRAAEYRPQLGDRILKNQSLFVLTADLLRGGGRVHKSICES